MNSDSYFEIGSSHIVCQDYALSGSYDGMTYSIISDGCSEAEHSEIGAQIICHVAKHTIILLHQSRIFKQCDLDALSSLLGNSIFKRIDDIRKLYPIPQASLQATLHIALAYGNNAYTFSWGDGVIISKWSTGEINVKEISYPCGAPIYLVTDEQAYRNDRRDSNEPCEVVVKDYWLGTDAVPTVVDKSQDPFKCIASLYTPRLQSSITICSDGIKSYKEKNIIDISLLTMAAEFTDFASTDGVFVECCMKFLKKKALKMQWSHYDDICCGAIII
jgi:hypothetical protein